MLNISESYILDFSLGIDNDGKCLPVLTVTQSTDNGINYVRTIEGEDAIEIYNRLVGSHRFMVSVDISDNHESVLTVASQIDSCMSCINLIKGREVKKIYKQLTQLSTEQVKNPLIMSKNDAENVLNDMVEEQIGNSNKKDRESALLENMRLLVDAFKIEYPSVALFQINKPPESRTQKEEK